MSVGTLLDRPRASRIAALLHGPAAVAIALVLLLLGASPARLAAQIDPEARELIQFGYTQPLQGRSPISGYAFYYHNHPGFIRTNLTLRLAIAPTYIDSELGFRDPFGTHTDFGLGIAGGGFADSYSEIRRGKWWQEESFTGHGGEASFSVYQLLNPLPAGQKDYTGLGDVPLQLVLRNTMRYSVYQRDGATAANFVLPDDKLEHHVRAGIRWGGREPLLQPHRAVELSAWYEGQFRTDSQAYGYAGDRDIRAQTHLLWGRALVAWEFENRQHAEVSITGGVTAHPDRFSAFRLGGALPMSAEFPLMIPGYYFQELSAERFVLLNGEYSVPLGRTSRWDATLFGGMANLDYFEPLKEPNHWHRGIGLGISYTSPDSSWHWTLGYARGIDALRGEHRGADTIGLILQYDLESSTTKPLKRAGRWLNPNTWRGFDRLFGR